MRYATKLLPRASDTTFDRFDFGDVLRKERGGERPKMLRLVVGNPLIMKEMAKIVPDAASYAPVTILIDERADGVHLSYVGTLLEQARAHADLNAFITIDEAAVLEALSRHRRQR